MSRHIAIIGSGMAGLAAAWYLGRNNEISLYERHTSIGIGAHSVTLDGGCVDVPLRVLYPGYYPQLFEILSQSGVEVEALDASLSFSDWGEASYFRYRNMHLGGKTLPLVAPSMLLNSLPRRILADLARFMFKVPRDNLHGKLHGRSIGDYLGDEGYGSAFVEKFLVPCFAGINTVSSDNVRHYPAELIAQYFSRGFLFSKVFRAVGGAAAMADALAARVTHLKLGARLLSIHRSPSGVHVRSEDGSEARFDAVVFATQANQVLPLLSDASATERSVLSGFRYGAVRVLMHRDPALAPRNRKDWAPVNYLLSDGADRPMVTIWVNQLLPTYASATPIFQTISPFVEADEKLIVAQADLQRPIVDLDTRGLIQRIDQLHAEPGRRVFFCGSYAATGIPLLESATVSAQRVAGHIGQLRSPAPPDSNPLDRCSIDAG